MKPVSSATSVPMSSWNTDADTPSSNTEPNNVPFQGVYGRVDPNAPTRAQVIEELARAKAAGLVTYGEQEYPPVQRAEAPHKTREQVLAELAEAKATGKYSFGELDYP